MIKIKFLLGLIIISLFCFCYNQNEKEDNKIKKQYFLCLFIADSLLESNPKGSIQLIGYCALEYGDRVAD